MPNQAQPHSPEAAVLRVKMLPAATRGVEYVTRDATVAEAATKMLLRDYSQLPVTTKHLRKIDGMITWRSMGRAVLAGSGAKPVRVRECLERDFEVVKFDAPLLEAVRSIVKRECVLVRGRDGRICGIVTASDLSAAYHELAAPFLRLGEIEEGLGALIDAAFSPEEIAAAMHHPSKDGRASAACLAFGEYARLLEPPENWGRLGLCLDRGVFVSELSGIRRVRNNLMHYRPDGLADEELDRIRKFAALLACLRPTCAGGDGAE